MGAQRLQYFLKTAFAAVGRAPGMACLSAASVSMVLVMMGTWSMAVVNLERLTLVWGRAANLSCVLEPTGSVADGQDIKARLAQLDGVQAAELVTPEAALARFAARSPEAAGLVEGVDPHILPATVELTLAGSHLDVARLQALAKQAAAISGVASVDFGAEVVNRLRAFVRLLRWSGATLGLLLALATVFLLSNTIRLTVYARRDEITILRLVGATPFFVAVPFLLEGALWGLGGGVLGVFGLWGMHKLASERLTQLLSTLTGGFELTLFLAPVAVGMLLAGLALGVLGSALALRRFLDAEQV